MHCPRRRCHRTFAAGTSVLSRQDILQGSQQKVKGLLIQSLGIAYGASGIWVDDVLNLITKVESNETTFV
jgi:hypothetical protein